MLIFDGPDLVGKSTLVKQACERLNARGLMHMPMHLTRPPECWDACQGYVEKMSVHTVWDRFHLSQIAYRACDDHPSQLTPLKLDVVEAQLRLIGGYSCVVTAEPEVIERRHAERGDDLYSLEHILRVNAVFRRMCTEHTFTMRCSLYRYHIDAWHHLYDTSENSYEMLGTWLRAQVDHYVSRLEELGLAFTEVNPSDT